MIINVEGIHIWILIAVLKHMTGVQPGLSVTQIMHHFMITVREKPHTPKIHRLKI